MSQNLETIDYEITLRDPQSILKKQLVSDLKVVNFTAEKFLKAGDNYGSTILKVRVLIKWKDNDKEEALDLIAKMLPPTNFQRSLFQTAFTFKKELFVYESLIPTYLSLYNGTFNVTPKFYGSRLSMRTDVDEVEEDAVLLMEDLKIAGYYMQDRHNGIQLEQMKIVVIALAKFHAIGLSIKYKKPSYLPILQKYMKPMDSIYELLKPCFDNVLSCVKSDPEMSLYFDRIMGGKSARQICENFYRQLDPEDPWACVIHSDLWTNNMLFHCDDLGNIDDVKFVDFQLSYVSSPLSDLIFCLCTSMEMSLECFDEMLELYRETAIVTLKELGCDVDLFTRENFEKRLKIDAINEKFHILLMSKVVELREGENIEHSPVNNNCLLRLRKVVSTFVEKNWI